MTYPTVRGRPKTSGITLSHPHGNPNSYHAARAFAERNLLQGFEQGIANRGSFLRKLAKLTGHSREMSQRNLEEVPDNLRRQHVIWEAASHIGARLRAAGPTAEVSWYDVLFCGHDWQVSKELREGIRAVYAYEDAARNTFRAAKEMGAVTIYELPAGYYMGAAQELKYIEEEKPDVPLDIKIEPQWKVRRKNLELASADVIVVPCAWAAGSLRLSDMPKEKPLITIPYGTPADEICARSTKPDGPFTVLFAGQIGVRKGVPYLLEAWSRIGLRNARLLLAGNMRLGESFLKPYAGMFEHLGPMPHTQLLDLMEEADLLVFPSLAEGFGLVIGEAMAACVPVLTTTNTGGPELITDGQEGWCIPPHDVQILGERIEWACLHRDELFEMGQLARRKAEQWTWSHYRAALIEKVTPYLMSVPD